MDKLVTTPREQFWCPDAWHRDQWIQAQAAQLPAGSWVLDAGAGASKYRPLFSHCRYQTQDFCQYQGPLVKYLQPVDFVCDITAIPLPDASLDAILCTEVLEHVLDPMAVIKEFSRLLKPGGKLWLTAPHGIYIHMEPYHFYNGLTEYWYRHWLPQYGLTLDSVASQGGPGRVCVIYAQGFYDAWRDWEKTCSAPLRLVSLVCRMVCKIPVHYVLPWLLMRFDKRLSATRISAGLMVAATRQVQAPKPPSA